MRQYRRLGIEFLGTEVGHVPVTVVCGLVFRNGGSTSTLRLLLTVCRDCGRPLKPYALWDVGLLAL